LKKLVAVFSQFIILIYLVGNTIMENDLLCLQIEKKFHICELNILSVKERERNGK